MRKGIATVSVSGTLSEKLDAVARANFDGVEIFENDLLASLRSPAEIRARAADLGLTIDLYQPLRDIEAVPPEVFADNLRRARHKFDVMEQLGATTVLVCSNVSPLAVDDDALAAEQLHRLAEVAHDRGLRVAYEALAWGRHVHDYRRSYEIVAAADHPHLGVCLDSFHILARRTDPAQIRDIPWEKIFFVQLADAPELTMDVLQWSRHYRCFPGQGGFDLPGFVAHVLAAGYRGPLSLEVFSDTFRRADRGRTAADAMRSLLYLEEATDAVLAADPGPAAAEARERVALFDPPRPARLTGYGFAEFALAPAATAALEAALRVLGFRRAGRHRSKPVRLWSHGDVHLLTNAEGGATAAGGLPALSAVGVRTDDQLRSANRADAFGARVLPRRRNPGEVYLPAVRLPDGGSLFFCATGTGGDPTWLSDFEVDEADAGATPLLTGVDHIALSVPFDRFDEAVLFFRAVLGLRPLDSLELADPYGLVQSVALADPDGTVRVVLNLPRTGGSTDADRPAALQHVAFRCDDIVAVAAELGARGARPLRISDNYYADLVARFDLPERQVARLRTYGILYDRAPDGGEFFHLYTELVGDRLFFEVVQRTGGYAGYGAANAATRLAAQR